MVSTSFGAMSVLVVTLLALAVPVLAVILIGKLLGIVFHILGAALAVVAGALGRTNGFLRTEIRDALHLVGGVITAAVIAPLALGNLAIGRLRSAGHFGRALEDEITGSGISLYRVSLGNPIRFLGLGALTEGIERRLPDLVSRAPRPTPRKGATPDFDGYKITGTLTPGGSGARLFLARPRDTKVRGYLESGHPDPGQVVIKSFALEHGSTLPQIVRESRALEAAKRLGLVLDHELDTESFWYAMPYIPGEDLDVVTRRMHAHAGPDGLDKRELAKVVGFGSDLLTTLDRFHRGGLWHKDIKPSNLIVSGDRVHLVDLGLVTPLASAMTLTTHGTEFFRDPELVRLAMKGVKVHDVDGVKFDLYSAGAVMYSMIENSFPAHGNLSRLSKRCPDALAWIVRRSMADIDQRYSSAEEMARDLDVLLASSNPFAIKPADLPSMGGARAGAARASFEAPRRATPLQPVSLESVLADPSDLPAAALFEPPAPPSPPDQPLLETDMRVRRRSRRGVLTAAAMFGMFFLMFSGLIAVARDNLHRLPAIESHSSFDAFGQSSTLDAGAVSDPWLRGERAAAVPAAPRGGRTTRAAVEATNGTVLLLTDLALDSASEKLEGLRLRLADRGFRVLGEGAEADDTATIELIAGARHAVELGSMSDPDARERLQVYLDDTTGLDAIIWLGPGSKDGAIGYRTFLRDHASR